MPPGVNPEAYQWFQTVDTDHSGFINLKELKQALVNSNWSAFNDETCLMMISKSYGYSPMECECIVAPCGCICYKCFDSVSKSGNDTNHNFVK